MADSSQGENAMHVNISRSKDLINKRRLKKKAIKSDGGGKRCNHCGGAIRVSLDLEARLMCAREVGHICERCLFVTPAKLDKSKKSA